MQFITAVTCHAATSVSLPPVGCTVLGAPWPRDCRVSLAAVVWLDRLHPRHPRCARLASTTPRIQSRGHRPRTICEAWGNRIRRIVSRSVRCATTRRVHRPRCTVAVGLPSIVRRSRLAWPTAPTFPTVRPTRVYNPTYPIPWAPPAHHFVRADRRCPSSHAGMAWKPSPTVGGAVDGQRGCDAPTSASTPQSRRFAPRQLPFQGSREGGVRRADVIRSPASSATPQSRRSAYSTLIFSAVMSFIVGQLAMVIMYSSSARLVLA